MNTQPKISVQDLLYHLSTNQELPSLQELSALSDLSRRDLRIVQSAWHEIPEARRLYVVRTLVEDAVQNIHLQLGQLLRLGLTDANSEIRRLAIDGLWEEVAEDLIGPFVQMLLNDSEAAVREAAAKALGPYILAGELDEIDTSLSIRAEEALLSVLQNEMESLAVQCRALESIAFSGEVGVRQLIEDAYYSPYEDMQVSALHAMGRSADIRWRSLVQAELQNPSAAMRAAAAQACGELEVQAAQQELLELLLDEDQEVRLGAIFALGRLGGEQAAEALDIVVASGNEMESEAAALALEEMLFYADSSAVSLFDESLAEPDEWDQDIWDSAWDEEL